MHKILQINYLCSHELIQKKTPTLKSLFPSFAIYVAFSSSVIIPVLILIGYIHYKKSKAFQSENDILLESNPYQRRTIINTEIIFQLMLKLLELNVKISQNQKLSDEETQEIIRLQKAISDFYNSRTFSNDADLEYLKKKIKH